MKRTFFPILLILLISCSPPTSENAGLENDVIALVGGTVLDVSDWGASDDDIEDAVVLIEDGLISSVGRRGEVEIPESAQLIDASGKFIIPGLIDGFAALNNQAYANAYLYMGVTSIISVDGGRRGPFFVDADPGPSAYRLEGVGDEAVSTEELLGQIDELHASGYKVVLLMYELRPDQLRAAVEHAHSFGMGTIGELGFTTYSEVIETGIDAFVHTTRYSLDIAPRAMARAVAEEPFSDDLQSPKWRYYKFLTDIDANDERLLDHASVLGQGNVALVPTFSLLYLDLPDCENLWNETVAVIIDPADVNNPSNKLTGKHAYDPEHTKAYADLAAKEFILERAYKAAGAHYLAGSGTDVWGTMPGISMHTELQLLTRIGLSHREAIAAATWNIAETYGFEEIGKIEAGRRADLLVLNADPLDDLGNLKLIDVLIKDGKQIDRGKLLDLPSEK